MARKAKTETVVELEQVEVVEGEVKTKSKRPKQEEIELKGEGCEVTTDKELIALGDDFIDKRDTKADLVTELKHTEKKILDRMRVLNLKQFRFGDQLAVLSTGKEHIKIKTVKNDGHDADTSAITEKGA